MQLQLQVTALTAFAFRNPLGMSFAHASCDLLLQRRFILCLLFFEIVVVYFYCKDDATTCACDGIGNDH